MLILISDRGETQHSPDQRTDPATRTDPAGKGGMEYQTDICLWDQLNALEMTYLVFTAHSEPLDSVKRLIAVLQLTRTPSLMPILEMLLPMFDCDTTDVRTQISPPSRSRLCSVGPGGGGNNGCQTENARGCSCTPAPSEPAATTGSGQQAVPTCFQQPVHVSRRAGPRVARDSEAK